MGIAMESSRALNRVVKALDQHNPRACTFGGTISIAKETFHKLGKNLPDEMIRVKKWHKTKVSFSIASTTILTTMAVSLLVVGILFGGAIPCIGGLVFVGVLSVASFRKMYQKYQYFKTDEIAPLNLIKELSQENLLEDLKRKYKHVKSSEKTKNQCAMIALAYHLSSLQVKPEQVESEEVEPKQVEPEQAESELRTQLKTMTNLRIIAIQKGNDTFLQLRDEEGSNTHDKTWLTWNVSEDLFNADFALEARATQRHFAFDLRKR